MHIKKLGKALVILNTDNMGNLPVRGHLSGMPAVQQLVVPSNSERHFIQMSTTPDTPIPFGTLWPQVHEFMVYTWLRLVDVCPGFFYAVSGDWYGGTGAYTRSINFRCMWSFTRSEAHELLSAANQILDEALHREEFRTVTAIKSSAAKFLFEQDEEESWSLLLHCQGQWYEQTHYEQTALGEDCDIRQPYDQEPFTYKD